MRSPRLLSRGLQQTKASLRPRMASNVAAASTVTSSSTSDNSSMLGALGVASLFGLASYTAYESDCCGIVGVVGKPGTARDFLLEGLTILQNRGYDSAGIATLSDMKDSGKADLIVTKYASQGSTADSINLLRDNAGVHGANKIGIAHTRWATHGGKTDENSHPHTDMREQIAVVHNGTITNYRELKNELIAKGVTFKSQTDTEVIAQLCGDIIAETGCDVVEAVKATCARLEGTWGICVLHRDKPEQIVVARNGSPLCVGYGDDRTFIASETTAFNRYTKKFVSLKDGEVAVVRTGGVDEFVDDEVSGVGSLQRFPTVRVELAPEQKVELTPAPYPHWTIREIMEQPKAIAASLGYGGRVSEDKVFLGGLQAKANDLLEIDNLVIAACGTSLNAGNYGAKMMRSLGSFNTIQTVDAAECQSAALPTNKGGILVCSQSGETKDVHRSLVLAMQECDLPAFSVVNAVGSLIARTTKCGVYCHAGRENAVASTKAFVTQVTVMGLIAAWFAQNRPNHNHAKMVELIEALHRLPITAGATLRCRNQCKAIAAKLMKSEHMFVLGKGYAEPVAHEGALKIKEITYLHAEGYSGGALKHGPFALIEDDKIGNEGTKTFGATPIILFILDDEHCNHMRTCAEEVRARGAYTIVVTDCPEICKDVGDDVIVIPNNGPMTALLGCIPLQMIAYELAVLRGINPDVPRNLAKAVTVD